MVASLLLEGTFFPIFVQPVISNTFVSYAECGCIEPANSPERKFDRQRGFVHLLM